MLSTIRLDGNTHDRGIIVSCSVTFDPDQAYVERGSLGRILVFQGCQVKTSLSGQAASIFQKGEGNAISVSGYLGMNNSSWGAAIPAQMVSKHGDFTLALPLRDEDIEAIEEARRAGDVYFNIQLSGIVQILAPALALGEKGLTWRPSEVVAVESSGGPGRGSGASVTIKREHWLNLLAQAGRRRYLVELPHPEVPTAQSETWKSCTGSLQEADVLYRSGKHELALGECRKVVEGIVTVLAEQWHVPKKEKRLGQWAKEVTGRLKAVWPQQEEHAQMLGALLVGAWTWTSPTHHYGSGVSKREEAAFTLHLSASLLSFAAQILTAHPNALVKEVPMEHEEG